MQSGLPLEIHPRKDGEMQTQREKKTLGIKTPLFSRSPWHAYPSLLIDNKEVT